MPVDTQEHTQKPSSQDETDDVLVTPEGEVLDQTVLGTAKIDLSRHKRTRANWDLLRSTKFAVAGLIYVLVREKSIRWVSAMTIAAVVAGFWLEIPIVYWAVLTISIGIVWITECLNTAIEATIDMEASRPHSMAKVGKDVAAAASLVATIVFIIIVLLILVPRFLDRVGDIGM